MDNDNSSSSSLLLLLFAPTLSFLLRIIVAAVGKSVLPLSLVLLEIRRGARPNLARNICVSVIDNSIIFSLVLLLLVDVMINVGGGRVSSRRGDAIDRALRLFVYLGGNSSVLPLSFVTKTVGIIWTSSLWIRSGINNM